MDDLSLEELQAALQEVQELKPAASLCILADFEQQPHEMKTKLAPASQLMHKIWHAASLLLQGYGKAFL